MAEMDRQRFSEACKLIIGKDRSANGIGTLGEKTLHSVLKNYFQPDPSKQEIPVGSFIADIVNGNDIIEIQTRQFNNLRRKLEFFLKEHTVTLVYPVAGIKWLMWIDQETGEVTKKRKSPKRGTGQEIFYELYKIKYLLESPNLRLCIVIMELEEYRYLNGWSYDRKRGSSRHDRIPVDIIDQIYINNPSDYMQLIPESLDKEFTSAEYKKASGLSLSRSQTALNVLHSVGNVVRIGKRGNAYIYERGGCH